MTGPSDKMVAQVRLACGRIAGVASAVSEAHEFGTTEGHHDRPWTADFHREAQRVYAVSLPRSYQCEVGALFDHAAESMDAMVIPGRLAEDWAIVARYLRSAAAAIEEWLATHEAGTQLDLADMPHVEESDVPPMVIHFEALAALTTRRGMRRLHRAAVGVQQHLDTTMPQGLTAEEQRLIRLISEGAHVPELATELGYSQRSIYRHLSKLWHKLGVTGRTEGLERAAAEGLLD